MSICMDQQGGVVLVRTHSPFGARELGHIGDHLLHLLHDLPHLDHTWHFKTFGLKRLNSLIGPFQAFDVAVVITSC